MVMMGMPVTMTVSVPMVVTMVVFMPVVPELGFVEQKEKHQAQKQGHEQGMWADIALESLGHQVQKRRGQQSACGQAEHVLGVTAEHPETEPSGQPNAANACRQSSQQNRQ
jgi:hypothetical protein